MCPGPMKRVRDMGGKERQERQETQEDMSGLFANGHKAEPAQIDTAASSYTAPPQRCHLASCCGDSMEQ